MMTGSGRRRLTACVGVAALASSLAASQQPPVTVHTLVDKAGRYVDAYQRTLAYLIADETYTQDVFDKHGVPTAHRVTTADFFITFVPGRQEWMAVRDVREVDAAPVARHEDIATVIAQSPSGRALAVRNAQFNIGDISRNFSEPTFALLLLNETHRDRVKFELEGTARDGAGRTVATVAFKENQPPPLVEMADGKSAPRPVYSSGRMTIDAATGEILATTLVIDGFFHAEMTTSFAPDAALGLLVPSTMSERYSLKDKSESISCTARYTNYRKFAVNVVIR